MARPLPWLRTRRRPSGLPWRRTVMEVSPSTATSQVEIGSGISHTVSGVALKSQPRGAFRRLLIPGQLMGDGGGELLGAQIQQPPADFRHPGKPEGLRRHAAAQGRGDLEPGHVPGETCAQGLEQCFLHRPDVVERVEPAASTKGCEVGLLLRGEGGADEAIEIAAGDPLLHVHAEPATRRHGDQSMPASVAHVEADGRRGSIDHGKRLSLAGGGEGELSVRAAESITEKGSESGAAEGEPAARTWVLEASPARGLLRVEAGESGRLAGIMRREIDVCDGGVADPSERPPPALGRGRGCCMSRVPQRCGAGRRRSPFRRGDRRTGTPQVLAGRPILPKKGVSQRLLSMNSTTSRRLLSCVQCSMVKVTSNSWATTFAKATRSVEETPASRRLIPRSAGTSIACPSTSRLSAISCRRRSEVEAM